jgi:hypothetical protein
MIHIFLRQTSHNKINSNRPNWFSYEKCFVNLLDTMDQDCKLNIVFDGDTVNHFTEKYTSKCNDIHLINTANGDWDSFFQTTHIVKKYCGQIKDNEIIYFLENDYLHVPGWSLKIKEIFSLITKHYVTLYDHKDKYFQAMYPNLNSQIIATETHHWRTTPSTCGSFCVTKKIFLKDYDIQSTMKDDHNKCIYLTKERGHAFLSPIPSLSTHCDISLLAPCIDWEKIT